MTSTIPVRCPNNLFSNCLNSKIYYDDQSSLWSTPAVQVYELFHICFTSFHFSWEVWTQWVDLAPNVWLHGSVGRASHRYRGGHGFESRWSLDFLRASSFQLLKLENLLWWSVFTLIYACSSGEHCMNCFIYASHHNVVIYKLNTCRTEYDIVLHNQAFIRFLILYLNIFYDQQVCLQ